MRRSGRISAPVFSKSRGNYRSCRAHYVARPWPKSGRGEAAPMHAPIDPAMRRVAWQEPRFWRSVGVGRGIGPTARASGIRSHKPADHCTIPPESHRGVPPRQQWGRSSVGRASRSQCEGRGFDSHRLHQFPYPPTIRIRPEWSVLRSSSANACGWQGLRVLPLDFRFGKMGQCGPASIDFLPNESAENSLPPLWRPAVRDAKAAHHN